MLDYNWFAMISPHNSKKHFWRSQQKIKLKSTTNQTKKKLARVGEVACFSRWKKCISSWFQYAGDLSATTKTIDFERLHNFARSAPQSSTTVRPFHSQSQPSNSGVEKTQQRVRFKHAHSTFKKPDDVDKVRKCAVILLQIKLKWDSRWNWSIYWLPREL